MIDDAAMTDKVDRMSNTPVESWPKVLLSTQVGLLLNKILGIPILEAAQLGREYTNEEAIDFIKGNSDMIKDKV